MSTLQTIEINAVMALDVIKTILPVLEAYVPAIAAMGGPIGLGISAASLLLPLLAKIPSGVISIEEQAALEHRIMTLQTIAFSGPQWQPRPDDINENPIVA